jgi:hypothetical protein
MARQVRVATIRPLLSDKLNRDLGTTQGSATVSTVGFSELRYQELQPVSPLNELSREQLIEHVVEEVKVGQVCKYRNGSEDNLSDF